MVARQHCIKTQSIIVDTYKADLGSLDTATKPVTIDLAIQCKLGWLLHGTLFEIIQSYN